MGWRDLLIERAPERLIYPWIGGKTIHARQRSWKISGKLPEEHGWYWLTSEGKTARFEHNQDGFASAQEDLADYQELSLKESGRDFLPLIPIEIVRGYLIGDRIVSDQASANQMKSESVKLIPDGLDRFCRIEVHRYYDDGPLIYRSLQMPLGPEEEVLSAFLDQKTSLEGIKGVHPALVAAFRMEVWRRQEAQRIREELEQQRRAEEEARALAERREQLTRQLGTAQTRREMALLDFQAAAEAALKVGGAEYIDHRRAPARGEMIVRFRLDRRRFECVCDEHTLRIIDAGICLRGYEEQDQYDEYDDYDYGSETVIGDTRFTLESLPSVIREAIRRGVLHVFRHVD